VVAATEDALDVLVEEMGNTFNINLNIRREEGDHVGDRGACRSVANWILKEQVVRVLSGFI
jgi:hypothetical protein